MFSITTPNSHFMNNDNEPAHFSEGVNYVRYLMKWALKELDYQAQRHALPLSFDYPAEYVRFMNEHIGANLVRLHNLLPTLSDIPSGNSEEDRYLRDKIIQKFEQAFEQFLANTQRLSVTTPPIFNPNTPCPVGLFQQVANDLYDDWRRLFEQMLALTDNAKTAVQHANNQGVVSVSIKADLPDSYQQLTDWLLSQAHWTAKIENEISLPQTDTNEQSTSLIGAFFGAMVLLLWAVFLFNISSGVMGILLLAVVVIWFIRKFPWASLGILLGISLGS